MESLIPGIGYTAVSALGVAIVFLTVFRWSWLSQQSIRWRCGPRLSRFSFAMFALGCFAWSVTGAADLLGFDKAYVLLARKWDIFTKAAVLVIGAYGLDVVIALYRRLKRGGKRAGSGGIDSDTREKLNA